MNVLSDFDKGGDKSHMNQSTNQKSNYDEPVYQRGNINLKWRTISFGDNRRNLSTGSSWLNFDLAKIEN